LYLVENPTEVCSSSHSGGSHSGGYSLPVTSLPSGYLTSVVSSAETGCGSAAAAHTWSIEGSVGQSIQVLLFDFNVLLVLNQIAYIDHRCKVLYGTTSRRVYQFTFNILQIYIVKPRFFCLQVYYSTSNITTERKMQR